MARGREDLRIAFHSAKPCGDLALHPALRVGVGEEVIELTRDLVP